MSFFISSMKTSSANQQNVLDDAHKTAHRDGCIFDETWFNQLLSLERKRAERSKRPFILMLVDISLLCREPNRPRHIQNIVSALISGTRETDLKGWYKHKDIIGVIFTELGETNGVLPINPIFERFHNSLCDNLDSRILTLIHISFHAFPEEFDKVKLDSCSDLKLYPDIILDHSSKKIELSLKRIIDVVGSLMGLIVLSPLFLVIALLIKLTSTGPVFFRQERVGQFGKRFTFLKFRSMTVNNNPRIHKEYVINLISGNGTHCGEGTKKEQKAVYKIENDPRVTPLGRFIRRTSLDELPQFFNVLKGDMSLVGPRPPIPYELECYKVWHRRRILEMRPGITGLWQVKGRSSTTFDEMVRLDIRYSKHWSLWLDIMLLFQTPWAALRGKGAY